ncbi:hypothetical protein ACFFLZ_01500 [Photobacterium aphoticum]|uniref:hypothetical protein n=1 Tax=Photobacterium aphoticum TaxID=754436 RepID=UPI00069E4545|nr:hypothetical protein [Photobacterium aphoticum]PSU56861.1 hypothetical protein C9I90_11685 [Photobacterium aphoticum]GHA41024.1 hypothetical protein GCM10007086_13380 [Photobacterium aphoticum]
MKMCTFLFVASSSLFSSLALSNPLPINQFHALQVLATLKISSSQLPIGIDHNHRSLLGEDANENDIRDDFEASLLESYQQPEYVAMGALAAYHWQTLLKVVDKGDWKPSERDAHLMMNTQKAIDKCYASLEKQHPDMFKPSSVYFNTPQRLAAQISAKKILRFSIDTTPHEHIISVNYDKPCDVFMFLADKLIPADSEY